MLQDNNIAIVKKTLHSLILLIMIVELNQQNVKRLKLAKIEIEKAINWLEVMEGNYDHTFDNYVILDEEGELYENWLNPLGTNISDYANAPLSIQVEFLRLSLREQVLTLNGYSAHRFAVNAQDALYVTGMHLINQ